MAESITALDDSFRGPVLGAAALEKESPDAHVEAPLSSTDEKVQDVFHINVTLMIVTLGLKKEQFNIQKLNRYADEATSIQDTMELLVNLNGELPVSEHDVVASDKVRKMAQDLKKQNIEILHNDERSIKPERMTEIKSLIGSHTDRLKTKLQQLFTTKIQVMINETNSLLEAMRTIIKYADRLFSTLIGNQRRQ